MLNDSIFLTTFERRMIQNDLWMPLLFAGSLIVGVIGWVYFVSHWIGTGRSQLNKKRKRVNNVA